jgi:NitT/TauT family transport system substrate-binding protein
MTLKRAVVFVVLFAVLAVLAVWLVRKNRMGDTEPSPQLTYRLKWLANPGFIGDLYADTYGMFAHERLQVQVLPGGPEHDALRELQTGAAQFGVASADQVIRAIDQGADVVVVAQIYQRNPVEWIYRSSLGSITRASALRGRRVGVTVGDNDETIMRAVLKASALTEKDVKLIPVKYDFSPFTTGAVELFPVYRNTQGVELQKQLSDNHEAAGFYDPEEAGVRFVANAIVTTSRTVTERPEVVRRFVRAAVRGWDEALRTENEEQAIRAAERFLPPGSVSDPASHHDILRDEIRSTRTFVVPPKGRIGVIDVNGWVQTASIMKERHLINTDVLIKGHLRADFLP